MIPNDWKGSDWTGRGLAPVFANVVASATATVAVPASAAWCEVLVSGLASAETTLALYKGGSGYSAGGTAKLGPGARATFPVQAMGDTAANYADSLHIVAGAGGSVTVIFHCFTTDGTATAA